MPAASITVLMTKARSTPETSVNFYQTIHGATSQKTAMFKSDVKGRIKLLRCYYQSRV
jgi:hypothetical protein